MESQNAQKLQKAEIVENKGKGQQAERSMNMVDINSAVSITTLNVNGLNIPIKRHCQGGSRTTTQL